MPTLRHLLHKKIRVRPPRTREADSLRETLENPKEVLRLTKYIAPRHLNKVSTTQTALTAGINKIGTKDDPAHNLKYLIGQATRATKQAAAKHLLAQTLDRLLTDTLTIGQKSIKAKQVSKHLYLKKVAYTRRGTDIFYLQARNLRTGQVAKLATALRLLHTHRGHPGAIGRPKED